ncbi:peptidoglycan DD-metalloendopeptidase family protein [Spirosoma spitsbergense]|uniref:peptidoglycan DD-metalloendopeptidase family protein n=1 Tax=Spirosoma spitsbergense TaxID=431554 RepID=UPI0003724E03|nr:peptidoglycan DD-metalloendopeptidase family protein [Spirosoma spitsbergense]
MLLPFDFQKEPYLTLDFSASNSDLTTLNLTNTAIFTEYVFGKLRAAGAKVGVGGYNEHRTIYRRSQHFNESDDGPREIHLGIDLWAEAGTPVFAPLEGVVHSFQDNANFGDYGPTIILEHELNGKPLYSLYGHLTRQSLEGLQEGKKISAGEKLAEIGPYPENGDWPPHLHFQLMTDMLGQKGDFPGVCSLVDRERFLKLCPDPNAILEIQGLR